MGATANGLAVGVVGASGYAGGELCRLLLGHPDVARLVPASRGDAELELERVHPNLRGCGLTLRPVERLLAEAGELDLVFLSAPAGEAMQLAPALLERGVRVVDLSADFRFADAAAYERTYGRPHASPGLLAEAVQGVTELNRERIGSARLVANPGCYVIGILLALAPLVAARMVDLGAPLHVNALNGSTGAGRTPRGAVMHAEMFGSVLPYSMEGHRHGPEIEARLEELGAAGARVSLATAHGSFARGIYVNAALPLVAPAGEGFDRAALIDLYAAYYGSGHEGEHFVLVNDREASGDLNAKDYEIYPTVAGVTGSNFCHIGLDRDRRTGMAKVMAAIDNLGKGAAGSAVQNMNVMLGLEETAGIGQYGI